MAVPLYDTFSADYDRFVDWDKRLAHELPLIEAQLASVGARRILDVACGTGAHAIALAERGYAVTGADLSERMIEQARASAARAGTDVRFVVAGFGELAAQVGGGFDAALCLGSSLPHVLTPEALAGALHDFAAVLRPGGLLLAQNRNFDAVMAGRERWMAPKSAREGANEWLFVRFYDLNPDSTLTFNVLTLAREGTGGWTQHASQTSLRPWLQEELYAAVENAGFGSLTMLGSMAGTAYDPQDSGNLIIIAKRISSQ